MKTLTAIALTALLGGCVVEPAPVVYAHPAVVVDEEVVYEPDVIVGGVVIGTYRAGFGYWTGFGWDFAFYEPGHPGYGHFYRGCPRHYWHTYRSGPHWHGHHR